MTVLDTFYLLFKTDAAGQAGKDIDTLEKKIDSLKAKGKTRSDDETKQLKELQKQHKELNQQLKETENAQSKIIDGIAGVVAGYAGFAAIKAGILNTAEYNRQLSITGKNLGQNTNEWRAYAAAVKAAGGNPDDVINRATSLQGEFALAGLPFSLKNYYDGIRQLIKGRDQSGRDAIFTQQGISGGERAFLEQSDDDYERAIQTQFSLANATKDSEKASSEFGTALDNLGTRLTTLGSTINEFILPPVTKFIRTMGGWVSFFNQTIKTVTGSGSGHLFDDYLNDFDSPRGSKYQKPTDRSSPMVDQDAMAFWLSKGYTRDQAAGILASEQAESGGRANGPPGDGGAARGLYQYHRDRRDAILAASGRDVWSTNATEAREGAYYEMSHNMRAGFNNDYFKTLRGGETGAYFSKNFESPLDAQGEALRRAQATLGIISQTPIGAASSSNSSSTSVKIDEINVHTQATDASGIAEHIGGALDSHIRATTSGWDDGIGA